MKEHKASDLRYTIIEEISGFTLVEVIVTLVILSILLTGAVMGIASWNRNSIYKRNNEYAQTLFIAAQTALAQEAAAGNSGELLAYVEMAAQDPDWYRVMTHPDPCIIWISKQMKAITWRETGFISFCAIMYMIRKFFRRLSGWNLILEKGLFIP